MNEIRTGIKLTGDASGLKAEFVSSAKESAKLKEGVDKVNQSTEELAKGSNRAAQSLNGVAGAVRQVVSVAAAWQLGKLAISTADEMTILHSRLKLVTSSASELSYVQGRLFVIAQQSRVNFSELGATYAQIARSSAELGISQDRLLGVTASIGQAMAISGGSAESMKAALVQLSQGLASGTLRGEELNSVMEQTPRLASAIAQGMGVSLGQLRALGQDGKLTALGVIEALEKAAPALRREFEQVTPTIGQAFTTLKNSSAQFVTEFDRATGSSKALVGQLSSLAQGISSVAQSVSKHEREWSLLTSAVTGAVGVGALALAYGKLAGGISRVGAALAANPGIAMLLGAGGFLNAAADEQNRFNASEAGAQQKVDKLQARIDSLDVLIARGGNAKDVERFTADRARVQGILGQARSSLGGFQTGRDTAREQFRALENIDAARTASAAMFPGAKPLEEVRKYGKLALDVQREAYDQSVEIAKSYQNRIQLATSAEDRVKLTKEMNARLIQVDKEAKLELKGIAEQGASEAKALAEGQFSEMKARLELSASFERLTLNEQTRNLEQFYKLGMLDVDEYYRRKSELQLNDLEISERLTRAELAQAKAVAEAARKQEDRLQAQARVLGLERELVDLATKKGAALAEPRDQRALRLKGEQDEVRDGVRTDRIRSRDLGYDLAKEMEQEVRRMGVDAIKDPYERGRAQLAEELRLRKEMIDAVLDPDARELATQRFNDFAVAKNDELAERMKPGFQKLLESWSDTSRLMRETYNQTMENMLLDGEDEFVRSGGNLVMTAKSIGRQIEQELYRVAYRKYLSETVSNIGGSILQFAANALLGGGGGSVDVPDDGSFDKLESNRLQKRAAGGAYGPGLVLRGERGPELSWENAGGYVFNASQTKDILAGTGGGDGGVQVILNITNTSGAPVQQTGQRRRNDGAVEIDVMVGAIAEALAEDVNAGAGPLAGAFEQRYGLRTAVA